MLTAAALASPAVADVPRVVTDIHVVHSLTLQVMGDLGQPELLLDQGGDPHSFQLRPSQARALADADLVFWIGPELTPWLERATSGMNPSGEAVALLPHAAVVHAYGETGHAPHGDNAQAGHGHEDHTHDDHAHDGHANEDHVHDNHAHEAHGHDDHAQDDHDDHAHGSPAHEDHAHDDHAHEGTDPHAWLDPRNARAWIGVIEAHLAEFDPANAATYAANAEAAVAGLDALEREVRDTLAPVAGRPLYVFHDAYSYFADAFGIEIAGSIAAGDAADPGAARLARIRSELVDKGAACVFAEANHNPAHVQNLVEGTDIPTGLLDPSGSVLPAGAGHYAATLRALTAEIVRCAGAAG
jgi:zinc transport system substrate-binding protein